MVSHTPNPVFPSLFFILFIIQSSNIMWTIDLVRELIDMKRDQIKESEDFIKEADFDRDITAQVKRRESLLISLGKLEEIEEWIIKTQECGDMNDYIAHKAYTYQLIEQYKGYREGMQQ